ncbi:hypothetical protein JCM19240_3551 [Vibrio maritimus]|uniref:Chitinase n=1 Tax=Vibrio maritimus TaxID=990268 RepID=A0A090T5G6_9VIBR|nr:hypothetical protein JCM19240_3551 [Vibrio maritimus]
MFHKDLGWSASWNYICLDDYCLPGTKTEAGYVRSFNATLGSDYKITFKVEDGGTQFITEEIITFEKTSCAQ